MWSAERQPSITEQSRERGTRGRKVLCNCQRPRGGREAAVLGTRGGGPRAGVWARAAAVRREDTGRFRAWFEGREQRTCWQVTVGYKRKGHRMSVRVQGWATLKTELRM